MLGDNFRPSGDLSWILSKIPIEKWDIIGCISFEARFKGALKQLAESDKVGKVLYFKIIDPSSKNSKLGDDKIAENLAEFLSFSRSVNEVKDFGLLEATNKIVDEIRSFVIGSSKNIILDISTFPKRFFFPILKILLQNPIKNLLVTYSTPDSYCKEELSFNPEPWANLPLFGNIKYPEPPIDLAIVGVGFMPFGLPRLLVGKYSATPVKFLFPFPPGPPNYQRTWEFMRKIEKSFNLKETDKIIKLDSNNLSDAYDYIFHESDKGKKVVIFAPYGPKPISLAMCLFAIKYNSAVYYTQPHDYNPNYSSGLKNTFCYSIILNSQLLY
jgi:hypothetical protein